MARQAFALHNKAKIQPAVRIDIRAFPKPKRQEEVCKDVANVMSPFVLANTMLPARTTMEEATFLLMPMRPMFCIAITSMPNEAVVAKSTVAFAVTLEVAR